MSVLLAVLACRCIRCSCTSACSSYAPLETMVSVCRCGQFAKNDETGIDIQARRVYVHCTPEADGSNPESGRSAERRRVWGQTWSCRRSALSQGYLLRSLQQTQGFLTTDDVYRQQAS
jgi:hypothetical protein